MISNEKEFLRKIALVSPDKEFMYYMFSIVDTQEKRKHMIEYIEENNNLTEQDLIIKAIEIESEE